MELGTTYRTGLSWALDLHATQTRKQSDVPYSAHLLAVSAIVLEAGGTELEATAALLHDALEDTDGAVDPFTLDACMEKFGADLGREIYAIVDACSDRAPGAPAHLACSIGGYFGSSYSITLDGNEIVHEESEQGEPVTTTRTTPTDDQWQQFHAALDAIGAWSWAGDYSPRHLVTDGTSWSATILRGDRLLQAHGSNGFPPLGELDSGGRFDAFSTALETLAGAPFR